MSGVWDWPGSRWWRCDLHLHSPASHDHQNRCSPEEWAQAVNQAPIDIIAITDHNTAAGIEAARPWLQKPCFPGVELTVTPGIHLLALFEPDASVEVVKGIVHKAQIPHGSWGNTEACSSVELTQLMDLIEQSGGLAILAHVDQEKGLFRTMEGVARNQVLGCPAVSALEIRDLEARLPNLENKKILPLIDGGPGRHLARIQSSDAHGLDGIGRRFTWIKMTYPSIEGLKLALRDGPSSLRIAGEGPAPDQHSTALIESISISESRYIGRGQAIEIAFNPWLNAIIGGRGTGKSSFLELARWVLNRRHELPDSMQRDWDDLIKVYPSAKDTGILTNNTEVELVYRKDGARYRIRRSPQSPPSIEREGDDAAQWQPEPGAVDRFPVHIYSQKQIFEMTKKPRALLQLIDDAPELDKRSWQRQWDEAERAYFSLKAEVRGIEQELKEKTSIEGILADLRQKLQQLEQTGASGKLRNFQRYLRQEKKVTEWEAELKQLSLEIAELVEQVEIEPLSSSDFPSKNESSLLPENTELLESTKEISLRVQELKQELTAIHAKSREIMEGWQSRRVDLSWTRLKQAARHDYEEVKALLLSSGNTQDYAALLQRAQEYEQRLQLLDERAALAREKEAEARSYRAKLIELRALLYNQRAQFIQQVLSTHSDIKITLLPCGDLEQAPAELREKLGLETGSYERDLGNPERSDYNFSLIGELQSTLQDLTGTAQALGAVEEVKEKLTAIRDASMAAQHRSFANRLQAVSDEQLDRLSSWFPEDLIHFEFRPRPNARFQALSQGSPGQRSAALITFLLNYGEAPIWLDQPEDDLDNKLIYDLVVKTLKEIKSKRQVIVITHNANIVVNGDAEFLTSLQVISGRTQISKQGGLQEEKIRQEICLILEGGSEAFEERYRRINPQG